MQLSKRFILFIAFYGVLALSASTLLIIDYITFTENAHLQETIIETHRNVEKMSLLLNEYNLTGTKRAEKQLIYSIVNPTCESLFQKLNDWHESYDFIAEIERKHNDFHLILDRLDTLISSDSQNSLIFKDTMAQAQLITHELILYMLKLQDLVGTHIKNENRYLAMSVLTGILVMFGLLSLSLAWFQKSVLTRIIELDTLTARIAKGNFESRVRETGKDELTSLAKSFNRMQQEISATILAISDEKEKLDTVLSSIGDAVIAVDLSGSIMLMNPVAAFLTGWDSEDAFGKSVNSVIQIRNALTGKKIENPLLEVLHTGKRALLEKDAELVAKDGRTFRISDSAGPLNDSSGKTIGGVIVFHDVTEEYKIREMIIQSEKMLSVGGLAAGMAHEINNPLAGMMQTAQVLKTRLSENTEANNNIANQVGVNLQLIIEYMDKRDIFKMLESINEAGKRAAKIVENMLGFARKSEAQVSSNNLCDLIEHTLELARTDYDLKKKYDFKSIEIIREYDENLPLIPCDSAKIQQVLLNIFSNGAHAMQISETKLPAFTIRTYKDPDNGYACIDIMDNGPGMEESVRKRVFEPFFTTKPEGVGTGLGLSVSYFIITKNHNGQLDVRSSPGQGAIFTIKLPINCKPHTYQ